MKVKSRDLIFIAIVIVVVGGLWWLSTRNKAKAMRPTPPEHLTARLRDECLKCHLPEKLAEMELQHKHPGKWRDARVECTRCHKPPQETIEGRRSRIEDRGPRIEDMKIAIFYPRSSIK